MGLSVDTLTFDHREPQAIATFWAEVLGYELVPEGKAVKNRLHLDLRPATGMAEEKERVLALGAREFRYVAEGGSYWTVMLDPEGNEFCVLRGPADGWSPDG